MLTNKEAIQILSTRDKYGVPCGYTSGYQEALGMAIDALQQTAWIPVGERLPEYRKTVLISTFWGVRVADRDAVKEDGTDDFWYMFLEDATAHPRYVYAWMPLPEAYKGGDNND